MTIHQLAATLVQLTTTNAPHWRYPLCLKTTILSILFQYIAMCLLICFATTFCSFTSSYTIKQDLLSRLVSFVPLLAPSFLRSIGSLCSALSSSSQTAFALPKNQKPTTSFPPSHSPSASIHNIEATKPHPLRSSR